MLRVTWGAYSILLIDCLCVNIFLSVGRSLCYLKVFGAGVVGFTKGYSWSYYCKNSLIELIFLINWWVDPIFFCLISCEHISLEAFLSISLITQNFINPSKIEIFILPSYCSAPMGRRKPSSRIGLSSAKKIFQIGLVGINAFKEKKLYSVYY